MPLRLRRRLDARLLLAVLTLTLVAIVGPGCNMAAWFAHGVAGGSGPRKVQVKAQYRGLAGKKVAVLVAADEYIQGRFPDALLAVSRAISARIADNIPDATLVPPQEVIDFQRANPYWITQTRLAEKLGVDRLVVVDLIEYRTHDPGNAWVWQGMIAAEISVMEAESNDPDNPRFATTVRAQYPEEGELGMVNTDNETVELGMLVLFTRDAAGLFYDHEILK